MRPLNVGVMRHKGLIVLSLAATLIAAWFSIHRTKRVSPQAAQSVGDQAVARLVVPSEQRSILREPTAQSESERAVGTVQIAEPAGQDLASDRDSEHAADPSAALAERRASMNAAAAKASALAPLFMSASRDRTWAETAEAELSSRIAQVAGLELTTLRIECRETVCRIDFTFPSPEYLETSGGEMAMAAVNGTPGYETGGLILVGNDGTLTHYVPLRELGD
ncbi:MAG TPA: hypothetical protein VM692_01210 [Gammaproteobacteria bacterium]|nr:hypothetical protein [Gammaproteobacteria bacterium]